MVRCVSIVETINPYNINFFMQKMCYFCRERNYTASKKLPGSLVRNNFLVDVSLWVNIRENIIGFAPHRKTAF